MVELKELVRYTDQLLNIKVFEDYCPNGLQVEGCNKVGRIIAGVTASQQLLDVAVKKKADMVLVHHGYFWRGEASSITGVKKRRIQTLLNNNISLLAYHLPLDAHAELGNNVQLAHLLGWEVDGAQCSAGSRDLVRTATLAREWSGLELQRHIHSTLQRMPLHIDADRGIRKIAWCTGAAQSYIHKAIELGADAYLTGEASEATVHEARENNIHFFAAGHHATERYGVQALAGVLAKQFDIECEFIDCPNPV